MAATTTILSVAAFLIIPIHSIIKIHAFEKRLDSTLISTELSKPIQAEFVQELAKVKNARRK